MRHPELYRPNRDFLDPDFLAATDEAIVRLRENGGDVEKPDHTFLNLGVMDAVGTVHADNIFSFKAFKPEYCELLLDEVLNSGVEWERNPDEDEYRSMPEITLESIDRRFNDAYKYFVLSLFPLVTEDFWRTHSNMMAIAQVAKYDPVNQQHGQWHHDASSDITFVAPLSAGFEGGGTEFLNQKVTVDPLPLGHVLCFPGRITHLHRGRAVTKGERYILTAWTKIIDGAY